MDTSSSLLSIITTTTTNNIGQQEDEDIGRHFYYGRTDTQDVVVIIQLYDRSGQPSGKPYHFHVNKMVLSANCKYFQALFSATTEGEEEGVKTVELPKSAVFRSHGKIGTQGLTVSASELFFDSMYNINSFWSLSTADKVSLADQGVLYELLPIVFYTEYTSLLASVETFLSLEYPYRNAFSGFGINSLVMASHYKMNQWLESIVHSIVMSFRRNGTTTYNQYASQLKEAEEFIPASVWHRLLREACTLT